MARKGVRVLPALDPGESYTEPNFLLVETIRNRGGQSVSTIDHISGERTGDRVSDWNVTSLGGSAHLSHADALLWATSYATAYGIPVVYERDDTAGIRGPK